MSSGISCGKGVDIFPRGGKLYVDSTVSRTCSREGVDNPGDPLSLHNARSTECKLFDFLCRRSRTFLYTQVWACESVVGIFIQRECEKCFRKPPFYAFFCGRIYRESFWRRDEARLCLHGVKKDFGGDWFRNLLWALYSEVTWLI